MPGLNQLKKLSEDVLALGHETAIRSSRGEKPVIAEIPATIPEASDADDFVLGMPDKNEAGVSSNTDNTDASHGEAVLTADSEAETLDALDDTPSGPSDIPDLEDILGGATGDGGLDDLDLSGFLDDTPSTDSSDDVGDDVSLADALGTVEEAEPDDELSIADSLAAETPLADSGDLNLDDLAISDSPAAETPLADSGDLNLDDFSISETPAAETPVADNIDFNLDDINIPEAPATETQTVENGDLNLDDFDIPETPTAETSSADNIDFNFDNLDIPETSAAETPIADDFDLNLDTPSVPEVPAGEDFNLDNLDIPEVPETPSEEQSPATDSTDFNLDDLDLPETSTDVSSESVTDSVDVGNESSPEAGGDFDLSNLDIPDFDSDTAAVPSDTEAPAADFDLDNTAVPEAATTDFDIDSPAPDSEPSSTDASGLDFNLDDLDIPDGDASEAAAEDDLSSIEIPSFGDDTDISPSSESVGAPAPAADDAGTSSDLDLDIPDMDSAAGDTDNFGMADLDFDMGTDDMASDAGKGEMSMGVEGEPDAGDVGNLSDFEIPDTDSTLDAGASDFELAAPGEFEIPGFSDAVGEAQLPKNEPPDFGKEEAGPRTSLTDEEYEKFKKNLTTYPLNVRIAVEELIAGDEFTDDVVFEVIDKILKKVSARQLAAHLEKLLDVSIDVPRDYERRSFAEYEAYKSSIKYQLLNRIIPMAIAGLVVAMVSICLFFVTDRFVYRPLKANSLYKQGYALLEADEYPQAEMKFTDAVSYHANKKWFFRYAMGYRQHKQYGRAETMYERILGTFNFDKQAGLEYAYMEMSDLANYERAEKIVRRYVLDHYINDSNGILLLGDIYLEWAGEKDASKFDDAREQYASLIQLYGTNDLYLSRMMRYFIRTDNLREVLQLKEHFFPRPKSLGAEDLTELSGYLLEKEYGALAPSEEYLRAVIEDVRPLLERAVKADPENPVAQYNMATYFVKTDNRNAAIATMQETINTFDSASSIKKKNMYKRIDAYRQLGELYVEENEFLKAEEVFSKGIGVYQNENEISGFEGDKNVGVLYSDMGDIDYFISGNMDNALRNYNRALQTHNDTPGIRYKVGVIQYGKQDYSNALGSFIKAAEVVHNDNNLLLALGNVLALRNDNYAAQGYYQGLLDNIAMVRNRLGILFPHEREEEGRLVDLYMRASNNLGVAQYRIAHQTGNSALNGQAVVHLSESLNAWDALTRNPETLVRLGGSNLAEQNIRYITHPQPEFEPAIYVDIPRTLTDDKGLAK